ncbi:MAG: alkaline phosphatase [Candidatus Hodarchaeales archaeon]|jgi:alkaline phosphatase
MFIKKITPKLLLCLLVIFFFPNITSTAKIASSYSQEDNFSVIIMIGDGMGPEQLKLARWVEVGTNGSLTIDTLNYLSNVTTDDYYGSVTDSAASGTTLASGVKTVNGRIGLDIIGRELESILEIAQGLNKSTGIVSTAEITHATPASFATHVSSRNNYAEIARQLVEESEVDIMLGGGSSQFTSAQLTELDNKNYDTVQNKYSLINSNSEKIFGTFSSGHIPYVHERTGSNTIPTLPQMTLKSLDILSNDQEGFFLMVEAGRIDHACHANGKISAALEAIEFDQTVKLVKDYVDNHDNTLLIVTADHETGGLQVNSDWLNNNLPNTENTEAENLALRTARAGNISVSWSGGTSHTDTPVPVYVYGPYMEYLPINNVIDNTDVFPIMEKFYDFSNDPDMDGMPNLWEYQMNLNPNINDALLDFDKDGLTNIQEYLIGSWANKTDTENDGLSDYYEYQMGLNITGNDANFDLDEDGLTNLLEYQIGSWANQTDTDNDELQDFYEFIMGLNVFFDDSTSDLDEDGLTNLQEYLIGSWANQTDTEIDGMPDFYEYQMGLNITSDDATQDLDEDGLTNLLEYQIGSWANQTDTDNDTLPDFYEYQMGLNITSDDANQDLDEDGLINLLEYQIGLWANQTDTENDGISDYYEYLMGLNASYDDSTLDLDGDGLTNEQEFNFGSWANKTDSDDDSMPDLYEYQMGLNATFNDAALDKDNDNLTNLEEYNLGTNASDPNDPPKTDQTDSTENTQANGFDFIILLTLLIFIHSIRRKKNYNK